MTAIPWSPYGRGGLIQVVSGCKIENLIGVTSSIVFVCIRIDQVGEDTAGFEGYTLYAG